MKWWKEYFLYPGSPMNDVNVRLIVDTQQTLENFVTHKKPRRELNQDVIKLNIENQLNLISKEAKQVFTDFSLPFEKMLQFE